MAGLNIWKSYPQIVASKAPLLQIVRNRSFIQKKLVTREECLKMSRTSKSDFQSILAKLKLSEQWPGFERTSAEVQPLKSDLSNLDKLYVRPNNSFPAYHRIEMIMQRLNFMSTMGLSAKEKIIRIKQNPPALILAKRKFLDYSEMVYLRGILREGSKLRYFFYPVFPRTCTKKPVLDDRLDKLAESLTVKRELLLQLAMSMPCFALNCNSLMRYKQQMVMLHFKLMPQEFDTDMHTLDVFPPILSGKIQPKLTELLKNEHTVPNFESFTLQDILDTSYGQYNGAGCAEDLTKFLLRSHSEEFQYTPPVNFKAKKIPRKQRRFYVPLKSPELLDW